MTVIHYKDASAELMEWRNSRVVGLAYDPWSHAGFLRIPVSYRTLPLHWRGAFELGENAIYLAEGMSHREERSTLAHEVQHALAGHSRSSDEATALEQERLADFRAAQCLINPIEYEEVALLHNSHIPGIAFELRVTRKVVEVWLTPTVEAH
jgi:hypothetical protein